MMRVIVTRPEREAARWVHDLSAHALEAAALPLIAVGPVGDTAKLEQIWRRLADYAGVMFVSGNAVEHFFASKPTLESVFTAQSAIKPRAWAPGPGTARALLRAGVAPEQLDMPPLDAGQFDSEALWQVVGAQVSPGDRVLVVRGGDSATGSSAGEGLGREWFANRLASVGAVAEFVVAYQRSAPSFSVQDQTLAREAACDGSVWLFSSSEAVTNLTTWLAGQSWAAARALATHPRIAEAAKNAGFGEVFESRPTLADLRAALQHMGPTAASAPG